MALEAKSTKLVGNDQGPVILATWEKYNPKLIFSIILKKDYCNFSKLSVHFNYALQHLGASKNGRNVTIYIKSKLENMCGHNVRPFSMTSVLNK